MLSATDLRRVFLADNLRLCLERLRDLVDDEPDANERHQLRLEIAQLSNLIRGFEARR